MREASRPLRLMAVDDLKIIEDSSVMKKGIYGCVHGADHSAQVQRVVELDCFFCDSCRKYVYNESIGDPSRGLIPGTRVDMLPDLWRCPECGATKDQLRASTLIDHFSYENNKQQADQTADIGSRAVNSQALNTQ